MYIITAILTCFCRKTISGRQKARQTGEKQEEQTESQKEETRGNRILSVVDKLCVTLNTTGHGSKCSAVTVYA